MKKFSIWKGVKNVFSFLLFVFVEILLIWATFNNIPIAAWSIYAEACISWWEYVLMVPFPLLVTVACLAGFITAIKFILSGIIELYKRYIIYGWKRMIPAAIIDAACFIWYGEEI